MTTRYVGRRIGICALLPLLFSGGCQGDDSSGANAVQRYDSAGIEIVVNSGVDHPLDWTFEEVVRIGGEDEGPEAFFAVREVGVETDSDDRIYVLDTGQTRLHAFTGSGGYLWSAGRQGEGPGEFEFPMVLTAVPGSRVDVLDYNRGFMVRVGMDGTLIDEVAVGPPRTGSRGWHVLPDGTYLRPFSRVTGEPARVFERLFLWGGDSAVSDTLVALELPATSDNVALCGSPALRLTMPAYLAPTLVWTAKDSAVAWRGAWSDYRIDMLAVTGSGPARSVRRELSPAQVTETDAISAFRSDPGLGAALANYAVEGCDPWLQVLEAVGYHPTRPLVERLALAPTGELWVQRPTGPDEPHPIDLFDPSGTYLGTLPPGTPFPLGFLSDDRFVTLEEDDLELQYVVVHRLVRGSSMSPSEGR